MWTCFAVIASTWGFRICTEARFCARLQWPPAGLLLKTESCIHFTAIFLTAGDAREAVTYSVDRSRDGGSFSARRVVAIQHERPIFLLSASFQIPEQGLEHQFEAPDVPDPDELGPAKPFSAKRMSIVPLSLRRWFSRFGPFEYRPVCADEIYGAKPGLPRKQVWFKLHENIGKKQALQRALLAYISDFHLISTAVQPHGISCLTDELKLTSIDHAMWFHRDVQMDDWLLYDCDSPCSCGGRALARGLIYDSKGRLIASTVQEGVLRVPKAGLSDLARNAG